MSRAVRHAKSQRISLSTLYYFRAFQSRFILQCLSSQSIHFTELLIQFVNFCNFSLKLWGFPCRLYGLIIDLLAYFMANWIVTARSGRATTNTELTRMWKKARVPRCNLRLCWDSLRKPPWKPNLFWGCDLKSRRFECVDQWFLSQGDFLSDAGSVVQLSITLLHNTSPARLPACPPSFNRHHYIKWRTLNRLESEGIWSPANTRSTRNFLLQPGSIEGRFL